MNWYALLSARSGSRLSRRPVRRGSPVQELESRLLLTTEPFQQIFFRSGTAVAEAGAEITQQIGDWNGDSVSDLLVIQQSGTTSGKVEVSVYSGAFANFDARNGSGANPWIERFATALPALTSGWEFRMDEWDGGGKPDLFAIKKQGTASGSVEVSILTGESSYTDVTIHVTTLAATAARWTFDVGHFDQDGVVDLAAIRDGRRAQLRFDSAIRRRGLAVSRDASIRPTPVAVS